MFDGGNWGNPVIYSLCQLLPFFLIYLLAQSSSRLPHSSLSCLRSESTRFRYIDFIDNRIADSRCLLSLAEIAITFSLNDRSLRLMLNCTLVVISQSSHHLHVGKAHNLLKLYRQKKPWSSMENPFSRRYIHRFSREQFRNIRNGFSKFVLLNECLLKLRHIVVSDRRIPFNCEGMVFNRTILIYFPDRNPDNRSKLMCLAVDGSLNVSDSIPSGA